MHKRWLLISTAIATAAVALFPISGCRHKSPPATTAISATSPSRPIASAASKPATTAAATTRFSSTKLGIQLDYPSDWTRKTSQDYELFLVPVQAGSAETGRTISLDVPDLPPHLPGMIPMRLVKNGYLDDLKKENGAIQTRDEAYPVAGVEGRLLVSHWEKAGKSRADIAVVIIHSDHVYILRATTDAAGEAAARAIFDGIAKSVQWMK